MILKLLDRRIKSKTKYIIYENDVIFGDDSRVCTYLLNISALMIVFLIDIFNLNARLYSLYNNLFHL